jgi:hypothetical protein
MAVAPQWKTAPERFTVIISEPYVANSDDVTDDFGDAETFRRWVVTYLANALSEYSRIPHSVKMVDDAMFVMSPLPLGDGYIDVPFPVKEKWEEIPGLTILVHPLHFWRHESKCHNRDGCIGNKSINLKVHYTIVSLENPNELAVLAHGGAYDESSFTFAMTKGNWESVVEGIAKKLVEKTPLER